MGEPGQRTKTGRTHVADDLPHRGDRFGERGQQSNVGVYLPVHRTYLRP